MYDHAQLSRDLSILPIFVILCLSSFLLGKALAGPNVKSGGVAQWEDGANMWKALGLSLTHKQCSYRKLLIAAIMDLCPWATVIGLGLDI